MFPNKIQHGDNLANLFQKYNEVIDYLRQTRLVAGPGMRINKLPAGITIESTATAAGGSPAAPVDTSHPFDAEIVNKGTVESPSYYVRIYNSALPDSPYAGIVYVGDWDFTVPPAELPINTDGQFFVDLLIQYVKNNNPPFSSSFVVRSYNSSIHDNYDTYRKTIAGGKLPDIASYQTEGNFEILGRWI